MEFLDNLDIKMWDLGRFQCIEKNPLLKVETFIRTDPILMNLIREIIRLTADKVKVIFFLQ